MENSNFSKDTVNLQTAQNINHLFHLTKAKRPYIGFLWSTYDTKFIVKIKEFNAS